jgi:hypothetical protein
MNRKRFQAKNSAKNKEAVATGYLLPIALAASKAAGYMSLQRPLDARIVTYRTRDGNGNHKMGKARGLDEPEKTIRACVAGRM